MRRLILKLYYRRNELSYNFLKEKDQNNLSVQKYIFMSLVVAGKKEYK